MTYRKKNPTLKPSRIISSVISIAKPVLTVVVIENLFVIPLLLPISNSTFIILQDFASRKSLHTSKWVLSVWDKVLLRERMGYSALAENIAHLEMNSFISILSSTSLAPFCFSCHKHLPWSQCSVLKGFFLFLFLYSPHFS